MSQIYSIGLGKCPWLFKCKGQNATKYVTIGGKSFHRHPINPSYVQICSSTKKEATHIHIGYFRDLWEGKKLFSFYFCPTSLVSVKTNSFIKFISSIDHYNNSEIALIPEQFFPFNNFSIFPLEKKSSKITKINQY